MKRSSLILGLLILLFFLAFFTYKVFNSNTTSNNKVDESVKTISSLIIVVLDKIKETDPKTKYFIKARNAYEPYQEFIITIDDERVWNLISVNQNYFVAVDWISGDRTGNIQGVETNLEQIEPISIEKE